jgi:hypothetical protein
MLRRQVLKFRARESVQLRFDGVRGLLVGPSAFVGATFPLMIKR